MSRLAAIAYAAILAGCSLSGPSTEQKVASKALLDASERCVHDVRDKNIKYERSPNCTSLKALSLQYIKTGGARAESALETEIDFERARVHAWMARAPSADPAATHIW